MKSALAYVFKTGARRAVTSLCALSLIALSSMSLVHYIDYTCTSPALGFGAILGWACLLACLVWLFVMAMSPILIVPSVLSDWARDPWRDEQISLELPQLDELDPRHYRVNAQSRFKTLFTLILTLSLVCTHLTYDGFLTRFQREGSARIALRSADREARLSGLRHLTTQVNAGRSITPSVQLTQELVALLSDADQGVREQVAFVIGAINLLSGVGPLTQAIHDAQALSGQNQASQRFLEVGILALGQMRTSLIDTNPARASLLKLSEDLDIVKKAPYQLAIALGLQRVQSPQTLEKLYSLASGVGGVVKVREAAIWALGEARDSATLPLIAQGLSDEALSVRCLAANALEKLAAFESSVPLRQAWPEAKKGQRCPLIETPKEAGAKVTMMPEWDYQHAIVHALASTDDPLLLTWLVEHQHDVPPLTHRLMKKYYEALTARDKEGLLEEFKRRNKSSKREESHHE